MLADISWLRANWGLSLSPELNQHPSRSLPRLDVSIRPDEVWLRVERQSLVALPQAGGALQKILRDAVAATGFARALRTMPEEVAAYKGIAAAREKILSFVQAGLPMPDRAG